ncbi:MAG: hypothetical protein RIT28_4583 [Pseudomonadota bacterium]
MIYDVTIGDQTLKVRVDRAESGYTVQVGDGPQRQVDARWVRDHLSMVFDDQRSFDVPLARSKDGWHVGVRGQGYFAKVIDPRRAALRLSSAAEEGVLMTTMPGRVVAVLVKPGDKVTKGQPLVVVEAMKMENELKAPRDGVVDQVFAQVGAALESGVKLLQLG